MNYIAAAVMGCMAIVFAVLTIKEVIDGLDVSKNFGRGYKLQLEPGKFCSRIFSLISLTFLMGTVAFTCCTGITVFPYNLLTAH